MLPYARAGALAHLKFKCTYSLKAPSALQISQVRKYGMDCWESQEKSLAGHGFAGMQCSTAQASRPPTFCCFLGGGSRPLLMAFSSSFCRFTRSAFFFFCKEGQVHPSTRLDACSSSSLFSFPSFPLPPFLRMKAQLQAWALAAASSSPPSPKKEGQEGRAACDLAGKYADLLDGSPASALQSMHWARINVGAVGQMALVGRTDTHLPSAAHFMLAS